MTKESSEQHEKHSLEWFFDDQDFIRYSKERWGVRTKMAISEKEEVCPYCRKKSMEGKYVT